MTTSSARLSTALQFDAEQEGSAFKHASATSWSPSGLSTGTVGDVMYTARKAGGGVNRVSRFVDKGDFGAEEADAAPDGE